jgi:hypothetical protein
MAIAAPHVTCDVIMVPLFPYLVVRHQISDLPTVVVNGRDKIEGALPEDDVVTRVLASGQFGPDRNS